MSRTLDGVVLRWPDMDLSCALNECGNSRMIYVIIKEIPEIPFQIRHDLGSGDTSTMLVEGTASSGSHDPE